MQTITVVDRTEARTLSFDLKDLLACLGSVATKLRWQVRDLECMGRRADELHDLAERGDLIAGAQLVVLAEGIDQVIDGEFLGYEAGSESPTVVLLAVDSSSWDIASTHEVLLDAFRRRFVAVVEVGQ